MMMCHLSLLGRRWTKAHSSVRSVSRSAVKPAQPPPCVSAPVTRASWVVAQGLPETWLLGNPSVQTGPYIHLGAFCPSTAIQGPDLHRQRAPTYHPSCPLPLVTGRVISLPRAWHRPSYLLLGLGPHPMDTHLFGAPLALGKCCWG